MKTKQLKAPVGASLVVLSSVFYASYGVWTVLMGDFYGGYTASALRSIIVLFFLYPVAVYAKRVDKINWKSNKKILIGMVVASAFVWGPLYFAVLDGGIGITLSINYAAIVIGMFFFGWLISSESFTKDKAVTVVLGVAGILLVYSPNLHSVSLLAFISALVSGLAVSLNTVFAKKLPYNAIFATVVLWITSVVANVPMALIVKEKAPELTLSAEWGYLVLFSIASVLASWLLIKGVKLIDAGTAGVLGLLEIVFAVIFGILFFNEHISAVTTFGICIIMFAALIPYLNEYKKIRKPVKSSIG